jgi:hypothetical protein
MRDNMIVNMSGHTGKGTGMDMNIEHLIRNDKVRTAIEMTYPLIMCSRSSFSFVESMRTGNVSGTSLRFVPSYRFSRSVAVSNSTRDIPDPPTLALTPAVTSG